MKSGPNGPLVNPDRAFSLIGQVTLALDVLLQGTLVQPCSDECNAEDAEGRKDVVKVEELAGCILPRNPG